MKLSTVLVSLLFVTAATAFADEPPTSTPDEPETASPAVVAPAADDAPGVPGENEAPTQNAPAAPKARLSNPTPHAAHHERPKDDGDGRLEKTEDTVAGGKHWR